MIKANELRIGNWVELNNSGLIKVEADNIGDIINNPAIFTPIPLTPEILEKCGFVKRTWGKPDSWDQYGDSYAIGHADTNYVLHRSWEKEPDWCMGIECTDAHEEQNHISEHFCWGLKTLHQLQNLYFALTGEELEVNI